MNLTSITPNNGWPDPTKPKPTDGTLTGQSEQQPKWQCNACKKIYDTEAEAAGCCCPMHTHARTNLQNTQGYTADLSERLRDLCEKDRLFFEQAFTDPTSGKEYDIPEDLKRLATRLCRSYGIKGTCDPMYIANIIAFELGLGDGKSNFKPLWKNESQSL